MTDCFRGFHVDEPARVMQRGTISHLDVLRRGISNRNMSARGLGCVKFLGLAAQEYRLHVFFGGDFFRRAALHDDTDLEEIG
jgi:hypothetical protein